MPAGLRLPLLGVGGDATSLGLQGRVLLSTLSGFVSSCLLKEQGKVPAPTPGSHLGLPLTRFLSLMAFSHLDGLA